MRACRPTPGVSATGSTTRPPAVTASATVRSTSATETQDTQRDASPCVRGAAYPPIIAAPAYTMSYVCPPMGKGWTFQPSTAA